MGKVSTVNLPLVAMIRTGISLVAVVLTAISLVSGSPASLDDVQSKVVGIATNGTVIGAGVPITSGGWGTDYLTVSHGLRVGRPFAITYDGKTFDPATPVAACSTLFHGIDVLILRVASRTKRPVVVWGDPAELKAGDELFVLPRPEIQARSERMTFVHINLLAWARSTADEWPPEWQNVMVADGASKPGFSGSPWVREGKVYGLHKGRVRPTEGKWFEVAETATRVHTCLQTLHYADLIPKP